MKLLPLVVLAAALPIFCQEKEPESLPQTWTKEPEGFQQIKFGDSEANILAKEPSFTCLGNVGTVYRHCFGSSKVGDVLVHLSYYFSDSKLVTIIGTFNSRDYVVMRPMLVERYGEPTAAAKNISQNAMGAKFENETMVWNGKTILLTARRFNGKTSESAFTMTTQESMQKQKKEREEKLKRDATKM